MQSVLPQDFDGEQRLIIQQAGFSVIVVLGELMSMQLEYVRPILSKSSTQALLFQWPDDEPPNVASGSPLSRHFSPPLFKIDWVLILKTLEVLGMASAVASSNVVDRNAAEKGKSWTRES
jgi:hypothetical protein